MDVIILESQLESLLLNHLGNFDFLTFISTSLWTWVAAVLAAAALSLWKIKSSTLVVDSPASGSHFLPPTKSDVVDDGYVLLHQQPASHKEEEDISPSCDDSCVMYTFIDEGNDEKEVH
ncbi:hypothetical protein FRX31_004132 [Thalictrum thalictroides]|uniref:Transmembrane protein n=1 Tax=Thalictrum thalictroides TaxID=46969 RepID=A0A7J6XD38_THATH|nr:hypothetical protein FRX31_004132 [Thalictrum thalictroides]